MLKYSGYFAHFCQKCRYHDSKKENGKWNTRWRNMCWAQEKYIAGFHVT